MLLVTGFLTVEWEQLRASLLCLSKLVLQAQKTTSQAHAQKLKKKSHSIAKNCLQNIFLASIRSLTFDLRSTTATQDPGSLQRISMNLG